MSNFWASDHLLFINKGAVLPYGLQSDMLVLTLASIASGGVARAAGTRSAVQYTYGYRGYAAHARLSTINPLRAAMVAEVPCNMTPRYPPSQGLANLPRYGS